MDQEVLGLDRADGGPCFESFLSRYGTFWGMWEWMWTILEASGSGPGSGLFWGVLGPFWPFMEM